MAATKAITYQPRWFQNRRLLLGTAGVWGISLLLTTQLGLSWPLSLSFAVQIVLFILLFHRPIWAMAALIVGQLTTASSLLPILGTQISLRFLWTILALLPLVLILRKREGIKLGGGARRIIIPAAIFFGIATISNYVNTDLSLTVKYLRMIATWLVILFLLPASVKNERDLKRLALVALITCSASAIVAVMQHYSFRGLPVFELTPGAFWGGRTSGLTESPVYLAFDLPLVILPIVAMYFLRGVGPRERKFLSFLALVMTAALFFTYTRSGMYSLVPGLLAMGLMMKGKAKMRILLVMLILAASFLFYNEVRQNRYTQDYTEDKSAAGRLMLGQAGLNIALDSPLLGIGRDKFKEVSFEYASTINPAFMKTQGVGKELGRQSPHNDFIMVWASFGTVALLAYLWLFVGIFRNFLDAYRHSQTRFLKGFSIGCFGAVAAYIVNAATHNVMESVVLMWILGSLSIATVKMSLCKRFDKVKEIR